MRTKQCPCDKVGGVRSRARGIGSKFPKREGKLPSFPFQGSQQSHLLQFAGYITRHPRQSYGGAARLVLLIQSVPPYLPYMSGRVPEAHTRSLVPWIQIKSCLLCNAVTVLNSARRDIIFAAISVLVDSTVQYVQYIHAYQRPVIGGFSRNYPLAAARSSPRHHVSPSCPSLSLVQQ